MNIFESLASVPSDKIGLVYIGQAGFLMKHGNTVICVDPYLTDSVDRICEKGDGLWTRQYPAPIEPEKTYFVDYVFISHDHLDHADPETITGIAKANPNVKFVCSKAIEDKIAGYGANNVIGLSVGDSIIEDDFASTIIPAAHEEIHLDEKGDVLEAGFVFDFGGITVYHSGDSLVYDGLSDIVRGTDVMLLPVNGNGFYRRSDNIVGNMDSFDAARLAKECNTRLLIPMHYDMYLGNSVPEIAVEAIVKSSAPDIDMRFPKVGSGFAIGDGIEEI